MNTTFYAERAKRLAKENPKDKRKKAWASKYEDKKKERKAKKN